MRLPLEWHAPDFVISCENRVVIEASFETPTAILSDTNPYKEFRDMLLHSWLSTWRLHINQFLGFVHQPYHKKRPRCEFSSFHEALEQRCLLTVIDLGTLGAGGITVRGADTQDQSGASVSNAGDVNGDGFDDLLIGAPSAGGLNNAKPESGESYLIFGGPSMPATIDLANLGSSGVTIFGADAYDYSGSAVSNAGDVNGDGFNDFLIGAPFADGVGNTKINSGESYLIFGGPALPSTIDLGNLGTAGFTIFGADEYDGSGNSLTTAGDVNGDGFGDLVLGASGGDAAGNLKDNAGETYIIFGGSSLPSAIDLATLGSGGVTLWGADVNDQSGISVSNAGDVNGDGFDDIFLGAPGGAGADNAELNEGESYVVFGGTSLPATLDLATLGLAGITVFGAEAGDQSGTSVSRAGDVNRDGFGDLIVGANRGDGQNNAKNSAGETYILFGGPELASTINLATLGSSGITVFGAEAADFSGSSVSNAGDINGDGFDDLVIGSGRDETLGDGRLSAGWTYVIFGASTLPTMIDLDTLDNAGITINGVDLGDRSGRSVSNAGDVNGDGFDDLLIGATGADGADNSLSSAGESYIVFGNGNHHPVFTSAAAVSVAENETAVLTLVTTDVDLPAQTVTYTISGGADQAKFTLSSNGVLAFSTAPDFERPADAGADNIYVLQVTANDGNGGLTNQSITVTVTPVNEPPEFTSLRTFSTTEHSTAVGTVAAIDSDVPAQAISYSVTGGADQAKFAITSGGVLSFVTAPDFQAPTDAGANNVYDLQITANDGNGGLRVQNIAVSVISMNSHVPVFTSSSAFNIAENTTVVGTLTASDADVPAQPLSYSITGGADQSRFSIASGGLLVYFTAPDFENPTDVGTNNVYNVQVTVNDGNGGLTVQQIAVTVTDVDDALRLTLGGPTVTWVNKQVPVSILPLATVGGGASLSGATLTISVNAAGTNKKSYDQFVFPSSIGLGTTSGQVYSNGRMTLQIQLNSSVTSSAIQTFLRGITFTTKTSGLRQATRLFDVTLANAGLPSSTIRQTINIRKR